MTNPFNGARTSNYYVQETTRGVTPDNPAWNLIRGTGGIPTLSGDPITSAELDDSREIVSYDLGNKQTTGDFPWELSATSQDELIAGAMSSTWQAGFTILAVDITVDATLKTFTRTIGDFVADGVEVGQLIAFTGLVGNNNSRAAIVTAVTTLVVTCSAALPLTDEVATATDYIVGDSIGTGSECVTFSILTWLRGTCGTADRYMVTSGVEFTGFSAEIAENANITGSSPLIGGRQVFSDNPPTGSTFVAPPVTSHFKKPIVGAIMDGENRITPLTSATFTNDNQVNPQWELDDDYPAFIERGNAINTFSGSGFLYDLNLIETYIGNLPVQSQVVANSIEGAMSFSNPVLKLGSVTPDRGGPASMTLSIEGQATGTALQSSLLVQRIVY